MPLTSRCSTFRMPSRGTYWRFRCRFHVTGSQKAKAPDVVINLKQTQVGAPSTSTWRGFCNGGTGDALRLKQRKLRTFLSGCHATLGPSSFGAWRRWRISRFGNISGAPGISSTLRALVAPRLHAGAYAPFQSHVLNAPVTVESSKFEGWGLRLQNLRLEAWGFKIWRLRLRNLRVEAWGFKTWGLRLQNLRVEGSNFEDLGNPTSRPRIHKPAIGAGGSALVFTGEYPGGEVGVKIPRPEGFRCLRLEASKFDGWGFKFRGLGLRLEESGGDPDGETCRFTAAWFWNNLPVSIIHQKPCVCTKLSFCHQDLSAEVRGGGVVARKESRGLAVDEWRTVLSGFGIGAALCGVLVFGFGQDIYDLELWWRMWPYNEPPLKEQYKWECARLRSLFLLLLLFSLSLLLFRREVVCWAATDCPDVEGEILI